MPTQGDPESIKSEIISLGEAFLTELVPLVNERIDPIWKCNLTGATPKVTYRKDRRFEGYLLFKDVQRNSSGQPGEGLVDVATLSFHIVGPRPDHSTDAVDPAADKKPPLEFEFSVECYLADGKVAPGLIYRVPLEGDREPVVGGIIADSVVDAEGCPLWLMKEHARLLLQAAQPKDPVSRKMEESWQPVYTPFHVIV